ncbi:MAG: lipoprotein [Parcubacteria group bacterium Gr01-1014_31]|nr:MAG: lipoprotein [Parcubacteria group bacterium Gr01-1014_31]
MGQVATTYGTKVAWVYRHFPLASLHANAQKEAEASECAAELGGNVAFWRFTDSIYERTATGGTGFALTDLPKLAKELGLNEAKFKSCLDSGKYAQKVQQDMTEDQQAGVTGTPGTVLLTRSGETRIISGAQPFDQVKTTIDQYVQ